MRTLPLMFLRRSEDFAAAVNVVCAGHGLNIEQRPLYVSIWTTLAASSQSLKSAAFRVVVFAAGAATFLHVESLLLEFKGNACAFPCAIGDCTACHQAASLRNYDMESSSAAYSRFHQPGWLTRPTNSGRPSMPVIAKTNGLSSVKSISSSGPIIAVASGASTV